VAASGLALGEDGLARLDQVSAQPLRYPRWIHDFGAGLV
jgi:uncharacterized membrane protein YjjP (DUF1212 family)